MSGITNRNYCQLFHTTDGELDHQDDEAESPVSSPEASMDFDMGCGIEAIQSINFCGMEYADLHADSPTVYTSGDREANPYPLPMLAPKEDIDWDSTTVDLASGIVDESHSKSPYQYEAFPSLIESELTEAAETSIHALKYYSCAGSEKEEGEDDGANSYVSPEASTDSEMVMNDDNTLAAAADIMSLHPPFWSISSDSDEEDDASFANNGWGTQEIRRGWTPEQCPSLTPEEWEEEQCRLENLHTSSRDERTREWLRRGGVSEASGRVIFGLLP